MVNEELLKKTREYLKSVADYNRAKRSGAAATVDEYYSPGEVAERLWKLAQEAESLPPELLLWIGIAAGTLMRLDDKGPANG